MFSKVGVLANRPQAGTCHHGVDLPAPAGASVVGTAPRRVIRIHKKGPGGLEVLVQHSGFVAIYSHLCTAAPAFAQAKEPSPRGEKLGVVELGHSRHARSFKMLIAKAGRSGALLGCPEMPSGVMRGLDACVDPRTRSQSSLSLAASFCGKPNRKLTEECFR